jgi:hypothetical protein
MSDPCLSKSVHLRMLDKALLWKNSAFSESFLRHYVESEASCNVISDKHNSHSVRAVLS